MQGLAESEHRARRRQRPLEAERSRRRLLLQQVPRRLLRADLLPHRLPQGQLPGRVHGGGDLLGDVDQGQGARSSSTAARRWGSRCCRPTSTPPTTASSSPRTRSASASTRSRTSATRRSRRSCAPARTRPIASIWDFCERVDSRAVNKRAIECLIKCGALDSTGATRKGMLEVLPAAQSAGQKAQEDAQLGPGLDLRLRRRRPAPAAQRGRRPTTGRRSPPTSSTAPSCWRWRRRRSAPTSPPTRWPRCARRCARGSTARSPSSASKPDGAWVTVGGIVAECKKIRTKSGSQMMFATLDDLEGQVEMLVFKADQSENAAGDRRPTRRRSSAAGSTTRTAARPSSSCRRSSPSSPTPRRSPRRARRRARRRGRCG